MAYVENDPLSLTDPSGLAANVAAGALGLQRLRHIALRRQHMADRVAGRIVAPAVKARQLDKFCRGMDCAPAHTAESEHP